MRPCSAFDPIALGLVASLNRPGGNATGIAVLQAEMQPKRFQLLRGLIPNASVFGAFADPAAPTPIHDHKPAGGSTHAGFATRSYECQN
jgi:ABC-type uncharacterized transport system substrate-binding protein